jgi:hypothetical protein
LHALLHAHVLPPRPASSRWLVSNVVLLGPCGTAQTGHVAGGSLPCSNGAGGQALNQVKTRPVGLARGLHLILKVDWPADAKQPSALVDRSTTKPTITQRNILITLCQDALVGNIPYA